MAQPGINARYRGPEQPKVGEDVSGMSDIETKLCPGYPECDHENWGNAGDVFSHGVEHGEAASQARGEELRAVLERLVMWLREHSATHSKARRTMFADVNANTVADYIEAALAPSLAEPETRTTGQTRT